MWAGVARFAAILGLSASSNRGDRASGPNTGLHGPAQNTGPRSSADGRRISEALIEARAAKATNKSLRALYLRQHQNLRRGA